MWEEVEGSLAIELGVRHAEDVRDDIEDLLRDFTQEASRANAKGAIEAKHRLRHKLEAVAHHADEVARIIEEQLTKYRDHRPPGGIAMEVEKPELVLEVEAFLFQVKACVDMLVQEVVAVVGGLDDIDSFRAEKRVPGKGWIRRLGSEGEKDLAATFREARDVWLGEAIEMRDTVTHRDKLAKLRCFTEEPYRGNNVADIRMPEMPDGHRPDVYTLMVYGYLKTLVAEVLSQLTPRLANRLKPRSKL